MAGSLVDQYGIVPDCDRTQRYDGLLTWSFQVRRRGNPEWLSFDEFTFPDIPLDDSYSGLQATECWYENPLDFASRELNLSLGPILGSLANVERIRISVWMTEEPPHDPFTILQATDQQMEIGQLRGARQNVIDASAVLEGARARLRDQILRMHSQQLLGVNKIAHEVENGGLSRRLVLGLIGGREIIRQIQWIVAGSHEPVFLGPGPSWSLRPLQEYSGPFECGPLILTLDADGTVRVQLDYREYDRECDGFDGDEDDCQQEYRKRVLAKAGAIAADVVPRLRDKGFVLLNADESVAGVGELAQTRLDYGTLIVRRDPAS